jgi:uncharacterized protein involved in outer membrane biogenesis
MRHLHIGRTLSWLLGALVVLIVAARIAAPYLIKRVVNEKLAALDGYTGSIDDVDLNLWRGAYEVEGIRIDKTGGKVPVPFVAVERLDLGVDWRALFDGSIVARVALFRPEVNFVKGPTKATTQTGKETDWRKTIEELAPLEIESFLVVDGEVHYRDFHAKPRVDVLIDHFNVRVTNLTNSKDLSGTRVATLKADGVLMHSGQLSVTGDIDPFQKQPTFHVKTSLEKLRIKELNGFLKAYVNVDAQKGTLSLYSDVDAKRGAFHGYVKPLIEGLDILQWNKEDERPIEKLWEGLVGAVAEVFNNQAKDRLATKIPLEGRLDKPDIHTWDAIAEVLRNAFIQALRHGLDKPRDA